MADKKLELVVFPVNVTQFPNEYTDRLKYKMFKESIKVDPMTCVFRHWASTRYSLDGVPTAHLFD